MVDKTKGCTLGWENPKVMQESDYKKTLDGVIFGLWLEWDMWRVFWGIWQGTVSIFEVSFKHLYRV